MRASSPLAQPNESLEPYLAKKATFQILTNPTDAISGFDAIFLRHKP